jgi:hypothetical protein
VYWHSLDYIPKGMLEKIRKKCFSFSWTWKGEKEGILTRKWKKLTKPKEEGGWGLNNVHLFGQASTTKNHWRMLRNEGL